MTPMNIIIIQGCIGTEPQLNMSGRLAFKMAYTVRYSDRQGNTCEDTTWYHVCAAPDEYLTRNLQTGTTVIVQGSLTLKKKTVSGVVTQIPVINADRIQIIKTKTESK